MTTRTLVICALVARGCGLRTNAEFHEWANMTRSGDLVCGNTGYDKMLEGKQPDGYPEINAKTVLFVIDVQKGFTVNGEEDGTEGGFAQPCLTTKNDKHMGVINHIVNAINEVKNKNGLVIATKDYHPIDHCSFFNQRDCKNKREAADTYAKEAKDTYKQSRYNNIFPPHCVGTNNGIVEPKQEADWKSTEDAKFEQHPNRATSHPRQSETMLHPKIEKAMKNYANSFIAYKGLSRDYESFGAFPMRGETSELVGAKLWKTNRKLREFNNGVNPSKKIIEEWLNGDNSHFQSVEAFLQEKRVENVVVVGYVYDFCVKETAIGASQRGYVTTVLASATRPAVDGVAVDGLTAPDFIPDPGREQKEGIALGGQRASEKAFQQMKANGVQQFWISGGDM